MDGQCLSGAHFPFMASTPTVRPQVSQVYTPHPARVRLLVSICRVSSLSFPSHGLVSTGMILFSKFSKRVMSVDVIVSGGVDQRARGPLPVGGNTSFNALRTIRCEETGWG